MSSYPFHKYKMVYLENTTIGHYKFYTMVNNGSDWEAHWGPIGKTGQKMTYPASQWDAKLREKLTKGYAVVDSEVLMSSGPSTPPSPDDEIKPIDNDVLRKIEEIYDLAVSFDQTWAVVSELRDIKDLYITTGILTKKEMEFLNRTYKVLTFDAKYNRNKETTIGKINQILGGLHEQDN